jgi:hypothetical protein
MTPAAAGDGFKRLDDRYDDYDVVDREGEKIGTVEASFLDEDSQTEYIEVKGPLVGRLLGTADSYLLPMEICTVDDDERTVRASADKETVSNGPALDAAARVVSHRSVSVIRDHYGL